MCVDEPESDPWGQVSDSAALLKRALGRGRGDPWVRRAVPLILRPPFISRPDTPQGKPGTVRKLRELREVVHSHPQPARPSCGYPYVLVVFSARDYRQPSAIAHPSNEISKTDLGEAEVGDRGGRSG